MYLSIDLPDDATIGDVLEYRIEVTDPSRIDAFTSELRLHVVAAGATSPPGKPNRPSVSNDGKGTGGGSTSTLSLPEVTPVHAAEYDLHDDFNAETALQVVSAGSGSSAAPATYDFFVNVDNKYLKILQKETKADAGLLEKQFTYALVLVGLALLQDALRHTRKDGDDGKNVEALVKDTTRALAPLLLPMIQMIGGLSADDLLAQTAGY